MLFSQGKKTIPDEAAEVADETVCRIRSGGSGGNEQAVVSDDSGVVVVRLGGDEEV